MANPSHKSEKALIALFLAIICSVPVSQTFLELRRGDRIQFTDVFRTFPKASELRQYEATLKEKSWVQQNLRPAAQTLLFEIARDSGPKVVQGLQGWLFYRPDIRCLLEPDRVDLPGNEGAWIKPSPGVTQRESVFHTIQRIRGQFQARGIRLLVVPVPGKPAVYPDRVTRRAGNLKGVPSPAQDLLSDLNKTGIEAVDLFTLFHQERQKTGGADLYLATDTHWTPRGAQLAARAVAAKVLAMGWKPAQTVAFESTPVPVKRWGDLLDMAQIPGFRQAFGMETVACEQIRDPALGLLIPAPSDRPGTYKYPGPAATLLVLGDSFSRIYQYPEPPSLGEAAEHSENRPEQTKRLLPGSAGFVSHLAQELKSPVDAIISDGGAATDVRRKLSTNAEILEGKSIVIWEFAERDIQTGAAGWEDVPLPAPVNP